MLVLNQRSSIAVTAELSAIQEIQALPKQSMEPGQSLADKLI
ncbi:MAG: hypothetical protein WA783_07925 [Phormidesmis sp.]